MKYEEEIKKYKQEIGGYVSKYIYKVIPIRPDLYSIYFSSRGKSPYWVPLTSGELFEGHEANSMEQAEYMIYRDKYREFVEEEFKKNNTPVIYE